MLRSNRRLQLVASRSPDEGGGVEALFRAHYQEILRYVVSIVGSGPPDPDDIVQSTFEKYAKLGDTAGISDPKRFLLSSARNYALDLCRRQTVRTKYAQILSREDEKSDDLDAERVLIAKQRWAVLEEAIQKLDERPREMLIMNRIHGLSFVDIARQKGCSPSAVKKTVARALVACERALRKAEAIF